MFREYTHGNIYIGKIANIGTSELRWNMFWIIFLQGLKGLFLWFLSHLHTSLMKKTAHDMWTIGSHVPIE